MKYILAKEVGDCPETRSFSQLFRTLSRIDEHAEAFYEENADVLDTLEDSYIGVRYLGREYSLRSAERSLKLLSRFREVFVDRL